MVGIEAVLALSFRLPRVFGQEPWVSLEGQGLLPTLAATLLAPVAAHAAWLFARQQRREQLKAPKTADLRDTVFRGSREWLWAIGCNGRFTFSSPTSRDLLGYEPSELLGQHWSVVIDVDEFAATGKATPALENDGGTWSALLTVCRHRDGTPVPAEISVRTRPSKAGFPGGYEGITRPLDPRRATADAAKTVSTRINPVLTRKNLQIWFQPIRCLKTGTVVGAEALSRFPEAAHRSPESWFTDAESVGLGRDLELLALETALKESSKLPGHLYVSINLSPQSCLDPRLHDIVLSSSVPAERLVLEVTERVPVKDYGPLEAALINLRRSGVRIAVDDAGAGFASMKHILQLQPDLIKLDQGIIAGINTSPGQRALGAAMMSFGQGIGAALIAEGIETDADLATVASLGIQAGQGYLLGKPSNNPDEWSNWHTKTAHNDSPFPQDH